MRTPSQQFSQTAHRSNYAGYGSALAETAEYNALTLVDCSITGDWAG